MHSYNHNSCQQDVDDKALCPMLDKHKTKPKTINLNGNENSNCGSIAKLKVCMPM